MAKNKILEVVELMSNARGLDKEQVFQALEVALAMTTKKRHVGDIDVRVSINRGSGEYDTFRYWTVVGDEEWDPLLEDTQIRLIDAREKNPDIKRNEVIEEPISSVALDRIAAQAVKQIILQKVKEASRKKLVEDYAHKIGSLITGLVKKVTRDYFLLDLGDGIEALLPRNETLINEALRMGDRIRAYLYDVHYEQRGPQLFVSRTRPEMLIELFKIEVPEIGEEVIQIRGAARDPGLRSKIAVKTNDGRIDPIGACVGMRGSRVQAVSSELGGERVEIVLWDDDPAHLVINAMAPAEVQSIVIDEETHSIDVIVNKEHLSQAIGRSGQNVKLASELTGWKLNVMSEEEADKKTETENAGVLELFVEQLGVEEEVAEVLVQEGFSSLEQVAYIDIEDMLKIPGFDREIAEELQNRAKDVLLTQALSADVDSTPAEESADDLISMKGMTEELAQKLASNNIVCMEDLAELSVDDLLEIADLDKETAAQLIMTAREPWFK